MRRSIINKIIIYYLFINIPLTTFYDSCRKINVYGWYTVFVLQTNEKILITVLILNYQTFLATSDKFQNCQLPNIDQLTTHTTTTVTPYLRRHFVTTAVVNETYAYSHQSARARSSRGRNLIGSSFVFKKETKFSPTHQGVGMGFLVVARRVV